MKPDLTNKWMDNELGTTSAPAAAPARTDDKGITTMSKLHDLALAMTRIVFALLFACHGAMKLFGAFGGKPMLHNPLMLTAGILEFGGGVSIALGLFTRPVAFVLCGEMAVAYFKAHYPGGFWPILNHGEPAVLYCFFFLYLMVRGAGAMSIDGLRGKA